MNQDNKSLLIKISELEMELKKVKKQKKYGLVWEEKPEQIVEDCKRNVPILRLKEKKKGIDPVIITDKTIGENILIEGDNYHALSVLNYTHKGKIDVIYIDPPYNTGNRSWKYNNDYVEKDDAFRHSKWISFISKRLELCKDLLSSKGIIVVTIDDYEIGTLRLLMDGIFGEENRLGLVTIMHNPRGRSDDKYFATSHEYALFYAKDSNSAVTYKIDLTEEQKNLFNLVDEVSNYRLLPLKRTGSNSTPKERPKLFFPIYVHKKTLDISVDNQNGNDWIKVLPKDGSGSDRVWRWGKEKINNEWKTELVAKIKDSKCSLFTKDRIKIGRKPKTIWIDPRYDASSHGTVLLEDILEKRKVFDYPKSIHAVVDTLKIVSRDDKDAIVLDFFAGSGTTGHAVLELNKQDGGNRKFILNTNSESNLCEEVTFKRLVKVISGYDKVQGLGGNLRYYKTDLIDIERLQNTPDQAKVKLTYQAGEMIGLRENTLNEVDKNECWQIFEGNGKITAIYFKEDKDKLSDLVELIDKKGKPATLYIFSWGKNEYKSEYSSSNVRVEDIPEPILEVYKEINRL